jgi:hypothetical protein
MLKHCDRSFADALLTCLRVDLTSVNTIHGDCITVCTAAQGAALENVLAFDAADPRLRAQLAAVFSSHGIPLPSDFATSAPGQVKVHSIELDATYCVIIHSWCMFASYSEHLACLVIIQ